MAIGWIEQKRRYRHYKARTERLPANYHAAIDALEGFEQSAANGTPIRAVVGEDPAEFPEAFQRNYPEGQWISRERERLANAIDRVTGDQP